jgi:putative RecB family exonuclease
MAIDPPTTLSPSKVSAFRDCALAFRFSATDRLPEAPSVAATRGSLVHRALELLFCKSAQQRTMAQAMSALSAALEEFRTNPELLGLGLSDKDEAQFVAEAERLVRAYFELENHCPAFDGDPVAAAEFRRPAPGNSGA